MTRRIHTLFAAGLAFALSAAVVSVQAGQAQEQKPKPHDMTGCLEKGETATTWKLTNVEGGKVKLVEISETAADLKMARMWATRSRSPAPRCPGSRPASITCAWTP